MEHKALKTTQAQRDASRKWEQANNEKITIKFRSNGQDGFTKADLQQKAKDAGAPSLNAWLLQIIRKGILPKTTPQGYPFTVYMSEYLKQRCKKRYERTKADPQAFVLQALDAYGQGISERNSFLLLFAGKDSDGFGLEQVESAAARDGGSVNAWIIEAIKDKL